MHVKDEMELARQLIAHFTFEPGQIPPTLSGFRQRCGLSLAEYDALAGGEIFAEAARDARARFLDTLTVGALLKKYDASFVKYLLDSDAEQRGAEAPPESFAVEVRVVE